MKEQYLRIWRDQCISIMESASKIKYPYYRIFALRFCAHFFAAQEQYEIANQLLNRALLISPNINSYSRIIIADLRRYHYLSRKQTSLKESPFHENNFIDLIEENDFRILQMIENHV